MAPPFSTGSVTSKPTKTKKNCSLKATSPYLVFVGEKRGKVVAEMGNMSVGDMADMG